MITRGVVDLLGVVTHVTTCLATMQKSETSLGHAVMLWAELLEKLKGARVKFGSSLVEIFATCRYACMRVGQGKSNDPRGGMGNARGCNRLPVASIPS